MQTLYKSFKFSNNYLRRDRQLIKQPRASQTYHALYTRLNILGDKLTLRYAAQKAL